MKNLSIKIQKNPDQKNKLLDEYQAESSDVRAFLDSLKEIEAYIVPSLIDTFRLKYRYNSKEINTISCLMEDDSFIGSLFCDEKENLWQYLGKNESGLPMCRLDRLTVVHPLSPDFKIKWLF